QDGAVLHTDPGFPLVVGSDCTVGHAAHQAAVQDGGVADRAVAADHEWKTGIRMQDGPVLDVAAGPEPNGLVSTPHDGVEPDADVVANQHVADQRGAGRQEDWVRRGPAGSPSVERVDGHGSLPSSQVRVENATDRKTSLSPTQFPAFRGGGQGVTL